MRVLLTGASGFIGRHTINALEQTHELVLLDINTMPTNHEFIVHDITKPLNIKSVDAVLHLAALTSIEQSIKNPLWFSEVNIKGTLNVLEFARKCDAKVVIASSASVYGNNPVPNKEEQCPKPLNMYATTKTCNELHARNYYDIYGLDVVCLRYFNVYGPYQNPNYGAVIPAFITSMLKGKQPVVYGDGRQTRDFVFVKDVAKANVLALNHKGFAIYNIASGKQTSILELYSTIAEIIGFNKQPIFKNQRKGDILHSYADVSKAKKVLGFVPSYSLNEGLKQTVEWFKQTFKNNSV